MAYITSLLDVFQRPIIMGFLLINLAIGWWAHRKAKKNSFEDYAMASRNLPLGVLVMTLLATRLGSGDLGEPGYVFKYGIINALTGISFMISFFLTGTFIAPSLVYFSECMTTGDLMRKFYGRTTQIITGVLGCIFSVLIISAQIEAIGSMSQEILSIPFTHAIIFFGCLAVLYSVWGGMRAVSYTDVLQMIAALVVLIYIAQAMMKNVTDWSLFKNLPKEKSVFFSHPMFLYKIKLAVVWGLFPTYILTPPIVQRMLMSHDKQKVRQMWYLGALLYSLISGLLFLIGLATIVQSDRFDLSGAPSNLLLDLIKNIFYENSLLRYLVFLGLLGVLLSTIDSYLHAIGVSVVQDIIKPLREITSSKNVHPNSETNYAKIGCAFTGIIAIVNSIIGKSELIYNPNTHKLALVVITMVLVPLIIGIFGIKTDRYSLMSFIIIYSVMMCRLVWGGRYTFYNNFLTSVPTGIVAYFLVHIYRNKGVAILSRSKLTVSERLWLPSWQGTLNRLHSWIKSPLRIASIADRKVVTTPAQPLAFSLVMISLYVASSMVKIEGTNNMLYMMTVIRGVGITLCVGLMLEGIWSKSITPYFSMYWFFTLWYCLPFAGTTAFLHSPQSMMSLALWGGGFAVLATLVDSVAFFILSTSGTALAFGAWRLVYGGFPVGLWKSRNIVVLVIMLISTISMLLFARKREEYTKKRLEWNRIAGGILAHDLRDTVQILHGSGLALGSVFEEGKAIKNSQGEEGYHLLKGRASFFQNFSKEMVKKANFSARDIAGFMDFMEGQILGQFDQKNTSMKEAILEAIQKLSSQISERTKIICSKDFSAQTLSGVFPNVIINLLKNASSHGKAQNIKITIDSEKRTVTVHDDGKGIPPEVLPKIFELNYSTSENKNNTGTGLSFVRMVMEASGGKVFCYSKYGTEGAYTEFILDFSKR